MNKPIQQIHRQVADSLWWKLCSSDGEKAGLIINEMIQDLANAFPVEEKSSWVSVKEGLPEDGDYYLVSVSDKGGAYVTKSEFAPAKETPQGKLPHVWWISFNNGPKVTHWQPLPPPPKQEGA